MSPINAEAANTPVQAREKRISTVVVQLLDQVTENTELVHKVEESFEKVLRSDPEEKATAGDRKEPTTRLEADLTTVLDTLRNNNQRLMSILRRNEV